LPASLWWGWRSQGAVGEAQRYASKGRESDMEVKQSVIQRFKDMRDEKLKALILYHRKYAELIKSVLDERKKE